MEDDMMLLRDAVDVIVARERRAHPEQSGDFWVVFRDRLLKTCIERQGELL